MGLAHERARASVRISLGKQTTNEDIDFAIKVLPETVARLREISPLHKAAVSNREKKIVSAT